MLHSPNFSHHFIVQTDASQSRIGAKLAQNFQGEDHPILYLSMKLHHAELCYSTIERETLAVKWAVESLQYYLANNPFLLVTDQPPQQWPHKVEDCNPRVLWWYLALSPFSFQILHQKGAKRAKSTTYHATTIMPTRIQGGGL